MKNNLGILVLAAVVAVVGFANLQKEPVTVNVASDGGVSTSLGAFPGPNIYQEVYFHKGVQEFTQGAGSVNIASGAQTLTQAQLQDNSMLVAAASTTAAAFTWTLPATSTLTTLLPDAGDSRMWLFSNENAAATTTTIAAGTGIILLEPDGQNVVVAGGNRAKIECWRDDSTDVYCNVDELIDAD